MKTGYFVIASVVCGLALGWGTTYAKYGLNVAPMQLLATSDDLHDGELPVVPKEGGPMPKIVVPVQDWDFGSVERDANVRHSFKIANAGEYPLVIEPGGSSCAKCTVSDLKGQRAIMPGQSTEVVVEYHALVSADFFRQSATILTNDPQRPRVLLTVSGKIVTTYRLAPEQIVLSHVSMTETCSTQLRLFACRSDDLQVTRCDFLDPETSKFYDAEISPLAKEELPGDAKSGALITITVKAGLPQGPLRQAIRLTTNLEGQKTLEIPIEGRVERDIRIFGRGWDDSRSLLELGQVASQSGIKRDLHCVIYGPDCEKVQFKVVKCEPSWLRITIDSPSSTGGGRTVHVPIKIEIPPGAPPGIYLDSSQGKPGEIVLETTHPQAKTLRLFVNFLVQ